VVVTCPVCGLFITKSSQKSDPLSWWVGGLLLGLDDALGGGLLADGLGSRLSGGLANRLLGGGLGLRRLLLHHLLDGLDQGLALALQSLDDLLLLDEDSVPLGRTNFGSTTEAMASTFTVIERFIAG